MFLLNRDLWCNPYATPPILDSDFWILTPDY